jgi:hypothetical protein
MAEKKAPEKSYDLNEAISKGLISKFGDKGAAGGIGRLDYIRQQGGGEGVFKPESFYTQTDTDYTNRVLRFYSANAKRGWAQRGTKAILNEQKKRTQQIKDVGGRELGEKKASAARLARVTGGLLAGAQTPGASTISTGPQLGGDDSLGNDSMLGRRTRI